MDRRCAISIAALSGLGAPPWLRAQPASMARVAWLTMERADPEAPFWLGFRKGMRELGWIEGQNVVIDPWAAGGSVERLRQLIPEVVASRPDVIVAATGTAVAPLIQANVPQPVVFAQSADPVIGKVVQSWARPGVNRTGISYFSLELVPKRLELMKQLLPRLQRVAIVGWPLHAGESLELESAKVACESLGLLPRYWGVASAPEVDAALAEIEKWRAEAILVFGGVVAAVHAGRFAAYGASHRVPTVSAWRSFAEAGNLMIYGPVIQEAQVRLASFVDRILKGAKAAEMPVELPTQIELVLNLKTARAIGFDIPSSLRLRADRLIE